MTTWQLRKAACFLAFSVKVTNPFLRPWGNGFCAVPRGGRPSPLFLCMGRQDLRVSPAGSVGPKRCPPGTRTLATPLGPWDAGLTCRFGRRRAFATGKLRPTPCKFFEKNLTKNFSLSPPNSSAGRLPAVPRKPRRPKAAFVNCPVRPRTACRRCACRCPLGG